MGLFASLAPAIVTGGLSLGGTLISNSAASREAEKNRDWQADMSNSAYQRGMADMKAAGLNPMLAYRQGGASTPSGATAQVHNIGESVSNSAMSAMRVREEIKNLRTTNENIAAQTATQHSQERLNDVLALKAAADAHATTTSAKLMSADLPARENTANIESSRFGKAMRWFDRVTGSAGGLLDVIKPFVKSGGGNYRSYDHSTNYYQR